MLQQCTASRITLQFVFVCSAPTKQTPLVLHFEIFWMKIGENLHLKSWNPGNILINFSNLSHRKNPDIFVDFTTRVFYMKMTPRLFCLVDVVLLFSNWRLPCLISAQFWQSPLASVLLRLVASYDDARFFFSFSILPSRSRWLEGDLFWHVLTTILVPHTEPIQRGRKRAGGGGVDAQPFRRLFPNQNSAWNFDDWHQAFGNASHVFKWVQVPKILKSWHSLWFWHASTIRVRVLL